MNDGGVKVIDANGTVLWLSGKCRMGPALMMMEGGDERWRTVQGWVVMKGMRMAEGLEVGGEAGAGGSGARWRWSRAGAEVQSESALVECAHEPPLRV